MVELDQELNDLIRDAVFGRVYDKLPEILDALELVGESQAFMLKLPPSQRLPINFLQLIEIHPCVRCDCCSPLPHHLPNSSLASAVHSINSSLLLPRLFLLFHQILPDIDDTKQLPKTRERRLTGQISAKV